MELNSLPEPVRRYAESAIPAAARAARKMIVTQVGAMVLKPGKRPLRFAAVEEFAVDAVAFAWRARFPILGPLALRVTDSYQPPDGLLEVRLLGLPVQRKRGPELARGEAFRYLAEIPWVPQAIVANRQLLWAEVDERTVEVSTEIAGGRVAVRLTFDGGEIIRTEAKRPRVEAGGARRRWVGEYSDYRSFGGIRVPARGEVRWELPDGPFTYWRGTITAVDRQE